MPLKMISSPYCAVSEPYVYKHYKERTRWNANRCYSLRNTYLIFETFQILFPTASLAFTAVKLFPFSSPEAALLLVSTKNRDLWPCPTPESRTSRHSAHVQSDV